MQGALSSYAFLLFPLPLIAALIATLFFGHQNLNYGALDFISETIFLGATHNYLSFAFCYYLQPPTGSGNGTPQNVHPYFGIPSRSAHFYFCFSSGADSPEG